jgi:hypothetical protein
MTKSVLTLLDMHIAAFYATYRPISITGPGPREVSSEDIDKLFQPKPKSRLRTSQNDVIYTFSNVIENLNSQIEEKQSQSESSTISQKADFIKHLTTQNEPPSPSSGSTKPISVDVHGNKHVVLKIDVQKVTNHFRPYNIPPAPTPVSQAELDTLDAQQRSLDAAAEAGEAALAAELEKQSEESIAASAAELGRQHRKKLNAELAQQEQSSQPDADAEPAEIVFNIRADPEDIANGQFFTSRMSIENPEISGLRIQDFRSRSRASVGIGRLRRTGIVRRAPSGINRKGETLRMISVKRQRRLKMKKHKYKKLMRKTRNLRRRLGNL